MADLERLVSRSHVSEVNEVIGVWEVWIDQCPIKLKIKVLRIDHSTLPYLGIANYKIQNSKQAGPYRSMRNQRTVQEAVEDALDGFLAYYDLNDPEIKYFLDEDW